MPSNSVCQSGLPPLDRVFQYDLVSNLCRIHYSTYAFCGVASLLKFIKLFHDANSMLFADFGNNAFPQLCVTHFVHMPSSSPSLRMRDVSASMAFLIASGCSPTNGAVNAGPRRDGIHSCP